MNLYSPSCEKSSCCSLLDTNTLFLRGKSIKMKSMNLCAGFSPPLKLRFVVAANGDLHEGNVKICVLDIFNMILRVSSLWYFFEGTLPSAAEKIVNEMIRETKDTGTRIMCEESNSFEHKLLTILGCENPIIFKDLPSTNTFLFGKN